MIRSERRRARGGRRAAQQGRTGDRILLPRPLLYCYNFIMKKAFVLVFFLILFLLTILIAIMRGKNIDQCHYSDGLIHHGGSCLNFMCTDCVGLH